MNKEHTSIISDDPENPDSRRVLRHIELIDDEAAEYGIKIVKSIDKLMAKKYGYRKLPGMTYFRKGLYAGKRIRFIESAANSSRRDVMCELYVTPGSDRCKRSGEFNRIDL